MPKAYLRYKAAPPVAGVIASHDAPAVFATEASAGLVVAPGLEALLVWDAKRAVLSKTLSNSNTSAVTALCRGPLGQGVVASGRSDGTVELWDVRRFAFKVALTGHRGAVATLCFTDDGAVLFSGARDNDIIAWDTVAEAGLFRLRGHKDMVTDLVYMPAIKHLVSASKDSFVKVWDLNIQHCVQTLVGHRGEVWSVTMNKDRTLLATGCADSEIRFFRTVDAPAAPAGDQIAVFEYEGSVRRQSSDRVVLLRFDPTDAILGCLSADKQLQIMQVADDREAKRRMKRRLRRKKSAPSADDNADGADGADPAAAAEVVQPTDRFPVLTVIKSAQKIRSFDALPAPNKTHQQILLHMNNNSFQVQRVSCESGDVSVVSTINMGGHRSDVRAIALSSDDAMLLSCSNSGIKLWNVRSRSCIRTMDAGYGLCVRFLPGDRFGIMGTKTGQLEIFDLQSAELCQRVEAHGGSLWSLDVSADGNTLVTGGADRYVRFWKFQAVADVDGTPKTLAVEMDRELEMPEDVLCVRFSRNQKLVAVSLLDATVRLFFADSLKFFISLYGHKLPVLSFDISSDSTLLVSASADKNVKLWGLDFGDCHKSIFAHDDNIMQVAFVPKTHYFFTVSKDRELKYWDGDTYELIQTLDGHHAEIWGLAISSIGDFVVTAGHDRSIRFWERTDEQLFLIEEREQRLEQMFERKAADEADVQHGAVGGQADLVESAAPGRRTIDTIKASERLLEAMDIVETERERQQEYDRDFAQATATQSKKDKRKGIPALAPLPPNPMLLGRTPSAFLLYVLRGIRANDLEEALVLLPFHYVIKLLVWLDEWIRTHKSVELCCKCVHFLLRVHQNQIVASANATPTIRSLARHAHGEAKSLRDTVGFNLAGLRFLKRELRDAAAMPLHAIAEGDADPDVARKVRVKKAT